MKECTTPVPCKDAHVLVVFKKAFFVVCGTPEPSRPGSAAGGPFLGPASPAGREHQLGDQHLRPVAGAAHRQHNGTRTPSTIDRQRARESPDLLYALVSAVLTLASSGSKASSV